jgi:DNA-binding NarL/FixJ family response regulator
MLKYLMQVFFQVECVVIKEKVVDMENDKNSLTNEDLLAKMQEMEFQLKAMEEKLTDALTLLNKKNLSRKNSDSTSEFSSIEIFNPPSSQQEFDLLYAKIPEGRKKVLNSFWLGKTDDEIADVLGISKDTVRNVLSKLVKDFKLSSDPGISGRSRLMKLYFVCNPESEVEKPKKTLRSTKKGSSLSQQEFDMIYAELIESQKKVLHFFLSGYTDEQIASAMVIQKKTIRSIFSLISQAFGLNQDSTGVSRRLRLMDLFITFRPELIKDVDFVKQRQFFINAYENLSTQRSIVLNLFWDGNTDEKIAELLSIDEGTVRTTLSQVIQSFGLKKHDKRYVMRSELMRIKTVIKKYARRKVHLSDEEIRDLVDNKSVPISDIARTQCVSPQAIYSLYHKKKVSNEKTPKVKLGRPPKEKQERVVSEVKRVNARKKKSSVDNQGVIHSLNTRMSVVLVGEKGSGKTFFLESIMQCSSRLITKKEIHYFDMAKVDPNQSVDLFLASVSTPCVLLLDNIDSLPPSFSVDLLNAVRNNPRILFVATAEQSPPINKFDVNWHFLKPRQPLFNT